MAEDGGTRYAASRLECVRRVLLGHPADENACNEAERKRPEQAPAAGRLELRLRNVQKDCLSVGRCVPYHEIAEDSDQTDDDTASTDDVEAHGGQKRREVHILVALDVYRTENANNDSYCYHQEWQCHSRCALLATAHDSCCYHSSYEALEEVRSHAGHVTHVVSYAVSDRGWVAWVVFRDVVLYLSHQVCTDICCLRLDATTNTCKQGCR